MSTNLGINSRFVLREGKFSTDHHRDENAYFNEGFGKPAEITRNITFMFGQQSKMYPLTTMLEGSLTGDRNIRSKTIDHHEYNYPVIGKLHKASVITVATTGTGIGKGGAAFEVTFDSNQIKRYNMVYFSDGSQARVQADPVKVAQGYKYTFQLNGSDPSNSIPASALAVGQKAVAIFTPVSLERSRGSETNSVTHGKIKNQIGVVRKSMTWGDKRNIDRVMNVTMTIENGKGGTKSTNKWMSWFMYQFELNWMKEKEMMYMYSKYNRSINGNKITLSDAVTGESIPTPSGLLEQIPNHTTYTRLTYKKLQDSISDAFYGQSDTNNMRVTLYTGKGGKREFNNAMLEAGYQMLGDLSGVADKFLKGEDYNLYLTGFFDAFYHIDGYYIRVVEYPLFDEGFVAEVRPKHPETGFSLESYRMVFVDDSDVDGEPNLMHLSFGDEPYTHGVEQGLTDVPADLAVGFKSTGNSTPPQISSGINEGAYHRMCSGGIQIKRATRCLHMECIIGL